MHDLLNYSLTENPLNSFQEWFNKAKFIEQNAEAMAVSSYDSTKNRPTTRYILFKGIVNSKILFYSNYLSPKSTDLLTNPEVALTFYWHLSKQQVRIHGRVCKMAPEDSARYFQSRDRDSQIASYLSDQSSVISSKEALLLKFEETKNEFAGKKIPLPKNWGGFLVEPYEYEFFVYGDHRLNDRFLYQLNNLKWEVVRLQP